MKRILAGFLLLLAAQAQAAIVWKVTKGSDCTGLGAPSGCCVVASPGGNPACLNKQSGGTLFSVRADFVSDGGTYTAGGDAINSANFGALGLSSVIYANCYANNGAEVVPTIGNAAGTQLKLKSFSTAGTETTGAVAATVVYTCDIYGK